MKIKKKGEGKGEKKPISKENSRQEVVKGEESWEGERSFFHSWKREDPVSGP